MTATACCSRCGAGMKPLFLVACCLSSMSSMATCAGRCRAKDNARGAGGQGGEAARHGQAGTWHHAPMRHRHAMQKRHCTAVSCALSGAWHRALAGGVPCAVLSVHALARTRYGCMTVSFPLSPWYSRVCSALGMRNAHGAVADVQGSDTCGVCTQALIAICKPFKSHHIHAAGRGAHGAGAHAQGGPRRGA